MSAARAAPPRSRLRTHAALLLLLLLSALSARPTHAQPAEPVVVVTSAAVTDEVPVRARALLEARGEQVLVTRGAQAAPLLAREDVTVLAVDAEACALLTRARTVRRACMQVRAADVPAGVAAVSAELSFEVQMALLARALPGRSRVLVLRAPERASQDEELRQAAARAGLQLTLVDVRSPGEAVPALQSALRAPGPAPVLLAVADRAVFTADTVAPIAQAAMAGHVPLVGFSPYFLKIGAVAALRVDADAALLRALALARATPPARGVEANVTGSLVVDGRLAARLGIPVRAGDGVEVRR